MSATTSSPERRAPGIQQMPGLAAEEGHGRLCLRRLPKDLTGIAIDAAGQIDRRQGRLRSLIALTAVAAIPSSGRARPAPNSASMMSSAPSRFRREVFDRTCPGRSRQGRIAFQL